MQPCPLMPADPHGVFKLSEPFWRLDSTCSYCGSLNPEAFMRRVEAGDEVGPTDKDYKVYLHGGPFTKFYFEHLSRDQKVKFVELLNAKKINFGAPGYFYVKPFFIS